MKVFSHQDEDHVELVVHLVSPIQGGYFMGGIVSEEKEEVIDIVNEQKLIGEFCEGWEIICSGFEDKLEGKINYHRISDDLRKDKAPR